MLDLVVVGGGFWGVATALVAERKGLSVCVLDAGRAGSSSPAASGYYAEGWYHGEWAPRVRRARAVAEAHGVRFRNTGARVHSKRGVRYRQDWNTFVPAQVLAMRPPDARVDVVRVGTGFVETVEERIAARRVVVAAGVWTDAVLVASGLPPLGVTALPGSAVVFSGAAASSEVILEEVTPYQQYAVREWGPDRVRVCATQERRPGQDYVSQMVERVASHVKGRERLGVLHGQRPVLKGGPVAREVASGVYAASGGGRTGAVLSFWAAEEVVG